MFASSGILDRHPELHVVFVEFNTGWLGWTMETADFMNERLSRYGTTANMGSAKLAGGTAKPVVYPELPEPLSFYFRRQIHSTFQDEEVGLHNVAVTGPESLLWGSDYPHEEGTYPHSAEVVARLWAQLKAEDAEKIFRSNGAKIFGFSEDTLNTPV
jgi:predicted TIM-barrel fold metal-dependent hydrolase